MHDYAFGLRRGGQTRPRLKPRMTEFWRLQSVQALKSWRGTEVLVVGHSSGAHSGGVDPLPT